MATDNTDMLLEEQLTFRIRAVFIEVSSQYGPGHKERVYQQVCAAGFRNGGLSFVAQPHVDIYALDSGERIAVYIPDFVIEERIVVELKAVPVLPLAAEIQLAMYLRATVYEVGMLVNFGTPKARIVRKIHTNDRKGWFALHRARAPSPSV